MNAQALFNSVVDHLLRQGVRSYNKHSEEPKYHADCGDRSAIGSIIPYHQYHRSLEGKTIISIVKSSEHNTILSDKVVEVLQDHVELLEELEAIHDHIMPEVFAEHHSYDDEMSRVVEELYDVAGCYGLEMPWSKVPPKYSHLHPKKVH